MYVCTRFHEIPAKGLQDIKEKGVMDGTDGRTDGQRYSGGGGIKNAFCSVSLFLTDNIDESMSHRFIANLF